MENLDLLTNPQLMQIDISEIDGNGEKSQSKRRDYVEVEKPIMSNSVIA